jgi:hypothetical protein
LIVDSVEADQVNQTKKDPRKKKGGNPHGKKEETNLDQLRKRKTPLRLLSVFYSVFSSSLQTILPNHPNWSSFELFHLIGILGSCWSPCGLNLPDPPTGPKLYPDAH